MPNENLHRTLTDLAEWLRREQIRFALIGGLAATVRGEPRFTADVDVVATMSVEQGVALVGRLDGSPFRPLFTDVVDVVRTAFLLPLRHVATNTKVDLALGLTGFDQQVVARATQVDFDGVRVPVCSAEDLILMKLLAGRPRDLDDVGHIVERQMSALDWKYLVATAEGLQEATAEDLVAPVNKLRDQSN